MLVFLYHIASPRSGLESEISRPWVMIFHAFRTNASFLAQIRSAGAILLIYICSFGWCGVAIFFLVSGFCIHLSFCQSSNRTMTGFYIRRFFRIYPPYIIALLIFATLFPASRLAFTMLTQWAQLVTHLLLIQNCSHLFVMAIVPDYWSIAVEAQLYLLFPLMLLAVRRWRWRKTLLALAVVEFTLNTICIVCASRGLAAPSWLSRSPFIFWFSWSIGAAIADAYLNRWPLPFQKTSPALWLFAALGASLSPIPLHEFSFTFFALFTGATLCRKLGNPAPVLPSQGLFAHYLRTTGRWSYSLYLIHHPILIAVVSFYRGRFPEFMEHPLLSFAVGLSSWIIIFPLSGLMYHFVERPSIAIGKKALNRWSRYTLLRHPEAKCIVS